MRHAVILASRQTPLTLQEGLPPMDADTASDRPLIQQMVVIHRVFRREFGLLPALIRGVVADDLDRARVVAAHAASRLGGDAVTLGRTCPRQPGTA
jgi:hypothetical protein